MGLVYGGTYFLEYISYLPWFKEHSPGTVLFLKVLETLCANPRIHALDFGYGDHQYKQTYGEECWEEASFYVFAPRLRPLLLNGVRTCALAVERALKGLARRFALDRWVKRRWRERLEAADAR
jgi:CelD/BcsL family acetyltransferase involved in cellulose biosynthesis